LLGCLLLVSSATAGWPQGESAESEIRGFYRIGDYVLEVDGEPAPEAEFYLAEHIPAIMILAPEQRAPVLVLPRSNSVQTVPDVQLQKHPDGKADLPAAPRIEQGKFQILASWVVFSVDGREWTLKESPWLLGVQDIDTLLSHNPEYVWRSKTYVPNANVIEELEHHPVDVNVRVYFGTWCAFCKQQVPLMMKVATELVSSRIHIEFYGLPRGFGNHPVAAPLKITRVPTGIVRVNEKEIGRITGNQWQSPETALKEIVLQ